jgi:hypothetical protein
MAKTKRGVQFNHKGSIHNGRRPSISESDGASDAGSPSSPTRAAMNGKLETSKEEVRRHRAEQETNLQEADGLIDI